MNRRFNVRLACWSLVLVAMLGTWCYHCTTLWAQEAEPVAEAAEVAPAATPPAPAPPADKESLSIGGVILSSGYFALVFYVLLALFSIVALAVVLERLVHLHRSRIMPGEFVRRLRDLIARNEGSLENLRSLCESSDSPIASILKAGVLRAGRRPLPEVEKAMEDAAARELAAMRSRNRPLSVVGSVAPLVGLLGTVFGMIFAFRSAAEEGLGKAEVLAEGIYLALWTTAGGLTIAIPCLLFAAWFNASAESFMREIDEALLETMPSFTKMENSKVAVAPAEPVAT